MTNKKANCAECSWLITEDGEIAMLGFVWTQFWREQFERDERRKLIYIWQMCTRLQVKYMSISKVNLYTMHCNFRISKRKNGGIYKLMYVYFVNLFSDCIVVGTSLTEANESKQHWVTLSKSHSNRHLSFYPCLSWVVMAFMSEIPYSWCLLAVLTVRQTWSVRQWHRLFLTDSEIHNKWK